MSNYQKIRELDIESEKKLKEGSGPADECLCSLLAPPDDDRRGFGGAMRHSVKRAFRTMSDRIKRRQGGTDGGVVIPFAYEKGAPGGIYSTKETVKRKKSCGKCGCDKENIILKHSYANIEIVTPDISSICPCPTSCLPESEKLNNISVTIERVETVKMHPDSSDSEASVAIRQQVLNEPAIEKRSITELINAQYDEGYPAAVSSSVPKVGGTIPEQDETDDISEWSFGIEVGEEQSAEEDEQPAEEKPGEGKPAVEKPPEEKPAEEKPAEEKPAADTPAKDKEEEPQNK